MVLDRGFRDVRNELKSKNMKVLMSALKEKRKEFITEKSNFSRYMTINSLGSGSCTQYIKTEIRNLRSQTE